MDSHLSVNAFTWYFVLVGEHPRAPYDDMSRYTHCDFEQLSVVVNFDILKLGDHDNEDEVPAYDV